MPTLAPSRLPFARRLSGLAWLLMAAGLASAEASGSGVYRWVDAQGRVHFGDPASAPPEARPVRVTGAGAVQEAPRPPPVELGPVAEPDADDGACEQARQRLETYRSAERIVETDSLGAQRELDAAAREQLLRRAERAVALDCAGASP